MYRAILRYFFARVRKLSILKIYVLKVAIKKISSEYGNVIKKKKKFLPFSRINSRAAITEKL